MKIAVDLDGTITERPDFLRELMASLRRDRNYVIVLTATFNGIPSREQKYDLLQSHRIIEGTHFDELVIVEGNDLYERGRNKAEYCNANAVDAIFEDCDIYIELIKAMSPKTVCWRICI